MKYSNYFCFDVETGGLDSQKNPITNIALIIVDSKTLEEKARWYTFVKPYADLIIEKKAIEGTLVKMSDIKKGIRVEEMVDKIIKIALSGDDIIKQKNGKYADMYKLVFLGHNVTFDIAFLMKAFEIANKEKQFLNIFSHNNNIPNYVDTMKMMKVKIDGMSEKQSLSLTNCCKIVGIDLVDAHGALPDTIATYQLFKHITLEARGNKGKAIKVIEKKAREIFQF